MTTLLSMKLLVLLWIVRKVMRCAPGYAIVEHNIIYILGIIIRLTMAVDIGR